MSFTIEQENIINSKEQYKSVLGVPGCGKTTVLCKELILNNNFNKLCVTRTNSVIEQINNKCKTLQFEKINYSNHFYCKYINNYIGIANIDSFIHYQLDYFNNNNSYFKDNNINFDDYRDRHNWKKEKFMELIKNKKINKLYLKIIDENNKTNNIEVNKLYIDEAQDMVTSEINLFISILNNNKLLHCSIYGDTLQTLNPKSTKYYSIMRFNEKLNAKEYNLSKCFRCPKGHIEFNNELFKSVRNNNKYGNLPYIVPTNNNIEDKPFIFSHKGMSTNSNAESIYNSVKLIINEVLENDNTINISDFTIVVNRINDSKVLPTIFHLLQKDFEDKFYYFETKDNSGTHTAIDFNNLKSSHCKCRDDNISSLKEKCKKYNLSNYSKLKKIELINKLTTYYNDNNIENEIPFKKFNQKDIECSVCKFRREKEKGAIISIDGFKGLESKCIIFLNLADKSIPRENHINKVEELTDYSKLNVLTTRSTKYLFIGINNCSPSRYFNEKDIEKFINKNLIYYPIIWNNKLKFDKKYGNEKYIKYEYLSKKELEKEKETIINNRKNFYKKKNTKYKNDIKLYEEEKEEYKIKLQVINKFIGNYNIPDNIPLIYKNLMEKFSNNEIPKSKKFRNLNTPDKNKLCVSSIAEDIDFTNDIAFDIKEDNFGVPCKIAKKYDKRVIGNMGNIIILRHLYLKNKINRDYNDTIQVLSDLIDKRVTLIDFDDLYIYNYIVDYEINHFYKNINKTEYKINKIIEKITSNMDDSNTNLLQNKIKEYFSLNKDCCLYCIKQFLNIEDIKIFLDKKIDNNKIPSKTYFNIAILIESLFEPIFRPVNIQYIDNFNEDINKIHENISKLIVNFNECNLEKSINFHFIERNNKNLEQLNFDKKINPEIFRDGYMCSLLGRSDIIEENTDTSNLLEIKLSSSNECNNSWCYQVILYYMMNNIKGIQFDNVSIVNILSGIKYKIKIHKINKEKIIDKILNYYKFIPSLKTNFKNKILYYDDVYDEI